MTEVVVFVGRFSTDLQAKQDYGIGEEIRERVESVCNEGLAVADYTSPELEDNQEDINAHAEERHRFAGLSSPCSRLGLGFFRGRYHKLC